MTDYGSRVGGETTSRDPISTELARSLVIGPLFFHTGDLADPVFDDGVQAPDGREFTILVRPRRLPLLGRSLFAALVFRGQYEVWVRTGPQRGALAWSGVVTQRVADDVGPRLLAAIRDGRWDPFGSPPPADCLG
jgi:hypothetical protein